MLYLTEVCDGVKYVDFERNITVKSFRVSFAYEYTMAFNPRKVLEEPNFEIREQNHIILFSVCC